MPFSSRLSLFAIEERDRVTAQQLRIYLAMHPPEELAAERLPRIVLQVRVEATYIHRDDIEYVE